jgi:hypothetical protein
MKTFDYLAEQLKLEEYRRECALTGDEPIIDFLAGELL